MYSKSEKIKIMIDEKTDTVTEDPFKSLLSRYQIGLETTIKGSKFIFDGVDLLHYKCHKTDVNSDGSYINSP